MKKPQFKTKINHCVLHIVPILCILSLIVLYLASGSPTSALTYQNRTNIDFSLNPTINLILSSSKLIINNLAPGSASDSNIITVGVSTNAGWGYYLSATTNTSGGNTNLAHETSGTDVFTSLSSNASDLSSMPDNTWGYSYSIDGGANWVSGDTGSATTGYNGLPLDNNNSGATGIKLLNPNSYASSGSIQFKIGAKASSTQASGIYTGTINFYAVTTPEPKTISNSTYLQDVEECLSTLPEEQVYTLKDSRDNQEYKVAKLKDGECWMVENLNLAGGIALSANDTDVSSDYITNFATSNNLIKDDANNTIVLPASSTAGFKTDNYSYVYNSGNKTNCGASGQSAPCYSYYSWDAATLGSGRSIDSDNIDAPHSICAKGWKLPTAYSVSKTDWQTNGSFYFMAHQYGLDSITSTIEYDSDFYSDAGPNSLPNFLLAGRYYDSSFHDGGSDSYYWSATSYTNTRARALNFNQNEIHSAGYYFRYRGNSVRCLFSG